MSPSEVANLVIIEIRSPKSIVKREARISNSIALRFMLIYS